jgi:hypothetical protein
MHRDRYRRGHQQPGPEVVQRPCEGAAEQLPDLANAVNGVGPGRSLAAKVASVQSDLAANDNSDACGTLNAFINEVNARTVPSDAMARMVRALGGRQWPAHLPPAVGYPSGHASGVLDGDASLGDLDQLADVHEAPAEDAPTVADTLADHHARLAAVESKAYTHDVLTEPDWEVDPDEGQS